MTDQQLPYAIYDTADQTLPTLQEIGDALDNWAPKPVRIQVAIWKALQTIQRHAHRRLVVTIPCLPPRGRYCIESKVSEDWTVEKGRVTGGTQYITVCPWIARCPGGRPDGRACEDIPHQKKTENGLCKEKKR